MLHTVEYDDDFKIADKSIRSALETLGYNLVKNDMADEDRVMMACINYFGMRERKYASRGALLKDPNTKIEAFMRDPDNDKEDIDLEFTGRVYYDLLAISEYFRLNPTGNTKPTLDELHKYANSGVTTKGDKMLCSVTLDKFNGPDHWVLWKGSTQSKLQTAGVERIVLDRVYAYQNPQLNSAVAGMLSHAFSEETSMVKSEFLKMANGVNITADGHAYWRKLHEYYEHGSLVSTSHKMWVAKLENLAFEDGGDFDDFAREYMGHMNIIEELERTAKDANPPINLTANKNINFKVDLLAKLKRCNETRARAELCENNDSIWETVLDIHANLIETRNGKTPIPKTKVTSRKSTVSSNSSKKTTEEEEERKPPAVKATIYNELYATAKGIEDEDVRKQAYEFLKLAKKPKQKDRQSTSARKRKLNKRRRNATSSPGGDTGAASKKQKSEESSILSKNAEAILSWADEG